MRKWLRTVALALTLAPAAAWADTATFMVTSGADDAYTDIDGTVHTSTTEILHGGDYDEFSIVESKYHAGYRFHTSGIHRGQVIQSAYLKFYLTTNYSTASGTEFRIYADTTPDSPDFAGPNSGPKQRADASGTTANTFWFYGNFSTGSYKKSPNISSAVQEVLNASTWETGDPMSLLLVTDGIYGAVQGSSAYEGNPATAAQLEINYDPSQFVIPAGATGEFILGATGVRLNVLTGAAGAVNLTATRTNANPGGTFSGGSATSPDSTVIAPDVHSNGSYWTITASGDLTNFSYEVSIDTTGLAGIADFDKLVILKRANSGSPWAPLNTTGSAGVLTATGQTSFSEFTVGSHSSFNQLPVHTSSFTVE